jgi:hypothetical protein
LPLLPGCARGVVEKSAGQQNVALALGEVIGTGDRRLAGDLKKNWLALF